MLMQTGAELEERNNYSDTPLVVAIENKKDDVAELLLVKGAKMINVDEDVRITHWMNAIITKRQSIKRGLLVFIGVLRKRIAVSGTEYTRGRLPRDVVGVISRWAWSTGFDGRWEGAVSDRR